MDEHIRADPPQSEADLRLTTERCLPCRPIDPLPTINNLPSDGGNEELPIQNFLVGLVALGLSCWVFSGFPIYLLSSSIAPNEEAVNAVTAVLLLGKVTAFYLVPGLAIIRRFQQDVRDCNHRINLLATLHVAFDFGLFCFLWLALVITGGP